MSDSQTIRRISWGDLFPWLILLRTFRIAISPPVLALATAAVLISPVGWRLAAVVFQPEFRAVPPPRPPFVPRGETLPQWTPPAVRGYLPGAPSAVLEGYYDLAEPLARLFQMRTTLRETAYYTFGVLWTLLLWSFPGAAITRRAVVQLAADAPPGLRETAAFAGRRWLWYLQAPLYPLIPVLVIGVFIALLGVPIYFWPGPGSVLAGLAWIFVVLVSLGVLWLLAGLMFGFPLMWPTISAERDGDAFEAFARSFSYVYGKPLHYFFYVVVAALFGALCWAVVAGAGTIVQEFGFWALARGGSVAEVAPIREEAVRIAEGRPAMVVANSQSSLHPPEPPDRGLPFRIGTTLMGLVLAVLHSVVAAFRYSYFFVSASAIYLLLRYDVDEKEMDEVYLDEPSQKVVTPAPAAAPQTEQPAAASPSSDSGEPQNP